MPKNRVWIMRDLLPAWNVAGHLEQKVEVYRDTLPTAPDSSELIGPWIARRKTPWGSMAELCSLVIGDVRGLWFYAGWHDQASLHVGKVLNGDQRLLPLMLQQFDSDRVDESGDMLVGFVPDGEPWLLCIEVSPERRSFEIQLRADFAEQLEELRTRLGC